MMLRQKRFWLGLIVSLILLVFVFYQTDPSKILDSLSKAQYGYLIPALVLYFIGVWIRAVRWHFLLRSIKPIPSGALFRTVVIGYMANDILPFRAGELVRAYVLGAQESVSKAATLVTIVVERVFDGLTMLTFIVAASFWLNFGDDALALRLRLVGALFIVAIAALAILAGMPRRVERIADFFLRRVPAESMRTRAAGLMRSLLEGLGALRSPVDSFAVYALSVIAWLCETGMYVLIALGFGITLPFTVFLLAAAFANLVTIAPSTPGYVGVFDAPIVYTLTLFGVNQNLATSYTLVLHAALYLPVTLLGFYYLWRAGLSLGQMTQTQPETG
ncbi:MAG TPA: lysylphosphatidylglycerol synthase transmembrane domain-containing protein [Anaerolineae bacterium]